MRNKLSVFKATEILVFICSYRVSLPNITMNVFTSTLRQYERFLFFLIWGLWINLKVMYLTLIIRGITSEQKKRLNFPIWNKMEYISIDIDINIF